MIEPAYIIAEKVELDERRQKLGAFVDLAYHTLPSVEWSRLNRQHRVMLEYSQILSQRIKAFNMTYSIWTPVKQRMTCKLFGCLALAMHKRLVKGKQLLVVAVCGTHRQELDQMLKDAKANVQ